uniref:zinc finger protein 407 n=1 Tax=Gasterosteus aculeatus aculeatus TaxID=481459 RepID=UPI001A98A56D|nr:zinc finger protein 407 [Gasterosteus aculeatus aculeatus]
MIIAGYEMDKALTSGKEADGDKGADDDPSGKVQPGDVEMEETQSDSPGGAAKSNEAEEEVTATIPRPDSVPVEGDNLCAVCGFSAKCPRSLKIHFSRKHGKTSKNTKRTAKPAEEHVSDGSPAEIKPEVDMETEGAAEVQQSREPDLGESRLAADDDGGNATSLTKKATALDKEQADQEGAVPSQERRVSKRTPKPKMIYSCNFCGQEFRDKSPLDVHIQSYHTKDTPYTFEAGENMDQEKKAENPVGTPKAAPTRVAPKRAFSRFQLKCSHCDFRVSNPALLENHTRIKHLNQEWYRCKLCNFLSATSEWMDAHLCSDAHVQQQKGEKSSDGASFDLYVESVRGGGVEELAAVEDLAEVSRGGGAAAPTEGAQKSEAASAAASVEEEDSELEPPRKKRGRPKQGSSTTCGYCGLVVSNATNLTVHVRRKHSKEYGYSCTLCNYSCVTKGDMDRHCITQKHVRRAQECAQQQQHNSSSSGNNCMSASSQESADESKADSAKLRRGLYQPPSDSSPKKSKYDSVGACSSCDFVAQSIPSLHLHVKRKHTKDFEYVCLACCYYAVTSREMSRHAFTEKHKQKSQRYLEPLGSEERKASTLPSEEVAELAEADPDPESECIGPTEGFESRSTDGRAADGPNAEPVAAAEKREECASSPSSGEADPTNDAAGAAEVCEPQQAPAEEEEEEEEAAEEEDRSTRLKSRVEAAPNAAEGLSDAESETSPSDTQISSALPYDACIVSMKALAEQEQQMQAQDLAQEGEAAAACLTGGAPTPAGFLSHDSAYIRKLRRKIMMVSAEDNRSSARIRCEDCGFMADGVSGLNVHISMKHPSKEKHFHCLVCGKSFYTESNLHQHLTSAAHLRNERNSVEALPEGGASFKCVKCTDRFGTEQDLFVHIKEKHEELLREVNKYVLEDTEQINREREENQGSVCKYCGKVCKSSNSMAFLAHIRTHTGSKPFMCKICNFATAQLGDARNHVKRHLGMREYKCDICGWAFVMKKHLSTHLLGKHGVGQRKERKFECELCDRSFSEKWALNNHMKLHSGEKPYKCAWPSCHYAFLNLSAMKDHYRTHTGEKSYLCDLCGFAGGTKHALTKHRRQHTGERPFKCKICNFASTTQSHLSRHKRVHTGEKPYRCPWCDYRSNCAENIRKHILHTGKHEGVKMYNCPKCNHATNSPMEFRNHLKASHPDIENPDLAYLHAGIVSKSFECRLKGQGAAFVESEAVDSPPHNKDSSEAPVHDEQVQQVIIIQGYSDEEVTIDQALEESAAATLQTLAMAGQVAEVLHITEDGQFIASGREVASAGAHLAGGSTQYVVLESGEARKELRALARRGGASHMVSESSTALDALLSAVSEMGQHEDHALRAEAAQPEVKRDHGAVQVLQQASQEGMQEVLQLAASQMMKEGLTQVIVNDEGTHYIVTELDNCTLQVEGGVYAEAGAADGEVEQAEPQAGEEMVVYLDGTPHNVVMEG